jgi:hypothetical protein
VKKYLKHTLLVLLILLGTSANSQNKVFEPTGSFSVDVGIPAQGKNDAFGRVMNGLFNGGLTYQYNIIKGFTLGVGAKYSFFLLNSFAFNNSLTGGYHIPSVFGKLGYEKFITERFSITPSLRMGYSMIVSSNDSCKVNNGGSYTEGAFFIEPQVELLLLTDKNAAGGFSFILGYNFLLNEFSYDQLCLNNIPNLLEEDYEGITRFLSIGFGYRYYMGRN